MYAPTPDGEVYILRGIPLDADYKHTLYFASSADQYAYFANKQKYWADRMMYVRETGRIRYNVSADMIDDCNYLMYRNQQYHDKWFYAFIKQVYYINDNCCEIEFELDAMQTYFFDVELKESWIERQHTITDEIGENIVEENLDIGGYGPVSQHNLSTDVLGRTWSIVMYSTFDPSNFQPAAGGLVKGIYSGLARTEIGRLEIGYNGNFVPSPAWVPGHDARQVLQDIVTNHADKVSGIVALIMTPTYFETNGYYNWTFNKSTPFIPIKNKKLLSYPFHALYVTDGNGNGKIFRPEQFGNQYEFLINSDNAPSQSVILTPVGYYDLMINFNECVIMSGFPQCSWTSDSFQEYLALNQNKQTVQAARYALGAGKGVLELGMSKGMSGSEGVESGVFGIFSMMADLADRSKVAPAAHGNVTGTAYMAIGQKTFIAYDMYPLPEYIYIIDDYFNKFGYAIHEVGVPNISSRPHWNYVKLRDAIVLPKAGTGLSASALKKIVSVYENGVTFWKNASEVGNYSLDNRPA